MEMVARFYMFDGSLVNLLADHDRVQGKVEQHNEQGVTVLFEGGYGQAFELFVGKGKEGKPQAAPAEPVIEQQVVEEKLSVEAEEIAEAEAMNPVDKKSAKGLFRKN